VGELSAFGKIFNGLGILMIIVGGLFMLGGKIPFLGKTSRRHRDSKEKL